ncbi:MAG: hypothetical protein LUG12_06765, partial [Erysipelotrichaceae bacterium]|nr:hypothetical protein [Erysipelotrichaceae bacterium]
LLSELLIIYFVHFRESYHDIMFYLNVNITVQRFMKIAQNQLYVDKILLIDQIASTAWNELGHVLKISNIDLNP